MASSAPAAPVEPPGSTEHSPDPKRWLALAVIAVAQLMVVLDGTIVNIALPSMSEALGISESNRHWVVTGYALAFGGLLLLGGRIADYMGRKRVFVVGLLGFAFASALGGAASNFELLLASRALQGLFAALMAPAALSLITVTFTEPSERAKAFGVYGGIAGGGAAIGLIMGGVLTEYASWRWTLLVNVPIALATAFFATRVVSESKAPGTANYDIPGTVAITAGLVSLVYGFTVAHSHGWSDTGTISYIALGVALIATFVFIEKRTANPLLPMRVLWNRDRGGSFLGSALATSGMMGNFLLMTFYFQYTLGYSELRSGFAFLPFSAGIVAAAATAGKILPKYGPRPLIFGGFTASAIALFWLSQIDIGSSYVTHALPAIILMSVGMGFAFVSLSSTALSGVSQHDAGVASAALNATQQVGGSLGTAILNTVAASATTSYLASHVGEANAVVGSQVQGYVTGSAYAATFLAIAALVSVTLIRSTRRNDADGVAVPAVSAHAA
jgi:EmrB/QacA subfamily drug resistance transporter